MLCGYFEPHAHQAHCSKTTPIPAPMRTHTHAHTHTQTLEGALCSSLCLSMVSWSSCVTLSLPLAETFPGSLRLRRLSKGFKLVLTYGTMADKGDFDHKQCASQLHDYYMTTCSNLSDSSLTCQFEHSGKVRSGLV